MKNLTVFYAVILFPIPAMFLLLQKDPITGAVYLLAYFLLYRPLVDGYRLVSKGLIRKENFWITFIFYSHIKYFKELYFN